MYDKQAIYDFLDANHIPYRKLEHQAVFTMEELLEAGIDTEGSMCKNLFLRNASGKQHYLVSVAGHRPVDLKALAEKLGSSRLSFASAERLMKHLGLTQGSVSPLGILNDEAAAVIMVFDSALAGKEIGVHPNDNTATVWLAFDDLRRMIEQHGNPVQMITLSE